MKVTLLRIEAPHFVAGIEIYPNGSHAHDAAPILRYMEGWTLAEILRYCKSRGWEVTQYREDKYAPYRKYVVHCKTDHYDVYIGRPNPSIIAPSYVWGNPFKTGDTARDVESYCKLLARSPALREKAKRELRGKILGCWCAEPLREDWLCHGLPLAKVANEEES